MLTESITFTDMELPTCAAIERFRNMHTGTVPHSWARVRIVIPSGYDELLQVKRWLGDNTTAEWAVSPFDDHSSHQSVVNVRFQSIDDALVFKLSDGYRAWER